MVKSPQPDMLMGWMGSLADATRLRLLRLLERHELGVVELCDILQLPQSTVSRHLKVLADQRWVRSRRQSTTHLYRTILDELDPAARRLWLLAREQTEDWATYAQDQLRLTRLLAERRGDSEAFFAGAAAQWDKLRGELYGESFSQAALLNLIPADWIVADLGCGTGQVTQQLASVVRQVIGVDNSAAMLKAARRRLGDAPNVDLRRGDLQALPIDDAACDAALMLLALTYVPDAPVAVREMARVLKPGGRAVVVDLLPHDRDDFRRQMEQQIAGISPAMLTDWMTAGGFTEVTVRPLPPEPDAKGPALFVATGKR
jgi:SAM-dependent methyltransferase